MGLSYSFFKNRGCVFLSHISQLKIDIKNIDKKVIERGLKMLGIEVVDSNMVIDYYGRQQEVHDGLLAFRLGSYQFVITKKGDVVGDFWQYKEDFIQNTVKTALLVASIPGVRKVNAKINGNGWEVDVDVDETVYQQQASLGLGW